MAGKKRKESATKDPQPAASSGVAGLVGATILLAALMVGLFFAWQHWGRRALTKAQYQVSVESIETPRLPPWIRADVKAEAFRDGSLSELSLLDVDMTKRVFHAFEMHPWVAKVKRVSKEAPGKVIVDLEYRQPLAWVEVPEGMFPGRKAGVLPIDRESVLLPQADFMEQPLESFLRISVEDLSLCGPTGTPWGDKRVTDAAAIATALANDWQRLGLFRIKALTDHSNPAARPTTRYELYTQQGKRLIWGSAIGEERGKEPSAQQKLHLLREYVKRSGPLDRNPIIGLDLRDVESMLGPRTASLTE